MKMTLISFFVLFLTFNSRASDSYINGNGVILALEAIHGIGAGVGEKSQSCLLCHASALGGPSNINISFGFDFRDRAIALGFPNNGGGSLPATGPNSLQTIFSDPTFASLDSDNDGDDNETEFASDTDPADDVPDPSSSRENIVSSGCGRISPPSGGSHLPPGASLVLWLPLLALWGLRQKRA